MTSPKEALTTDRELPEGMSGPTWTRISALSDTPTVRHPLGLRYAVLERSSILHYDFGLGWAEADERALAEEAGASFHQKLVGA